MNMQKTGCANAKQKQKKKNKTRDSQREGQSKLLHEAHSIEVSNYQRAALYYFLQIGFPFIIGASSRSNVHSGQVSQPNNCSASIFFSSSAIPGAARSGGSISPGARAVTPQT